MNTSATTSSIRHSTNESDPKPNGQRFRDATAKSVAIETPSAFVLPIQLQLSPLPVIDGILTFIWDILTFFSRYR